MSKLEGFLGSLGFKSKAKIKEQAAQAIKNAGADPVFEEKFKEVKPVLDQNERTLRYDEMTLRVAENKQEEKTSDETDTIRQIRNRLNLPNNEKAPMDEYMLGAGNVDELINSLEKQNEGLDWFKDLLEAYDEKIEALKKSLEEINQEAHLQELINKEGDTKKANEKISTQDQFFLSQLRGYEKVRDKIAHRINEISQNS